MPKSLEQYKEYIAGRTYTLKILKEATTREITLGLAEALLSEIHSIEEEIGSQKTKPERK